ncbi:DUF3293 domain-containing protein [Deinococcus sp.]|uniref:DUF3293 domain-containing protein n=1 Tax=Deinococcus sp. TaxID=47478 RepID=UPI0025BEC39A|nr:DUF3293 domain-containing protein [Deinococcus sp.]
MDTARLMDTVERREAQRQRDRLRSAFTAAEYGLTDERFRLSCTRGTSPSWATTGLAWATVTAWNPEGKMCSRPANQQRQAALKTSVIQRGLPFLEGVNGSGEWQEDTLIVLGARLSDAVNWGQQTGQVAVLYGLGARVALVWIKPLKAERFWAARL